MHHSDKAEAAPQCDSIYTESFMAEVTSILCPVCYKPNAPTAKYCSYCGSNIILNDDIPSDDRRYFITRIIKQGGQGSVYEGVDQNGNVYAIKEMHDQFLDDKERDDATRRFNAEAEILTNLRHPGIPCIYSHFTDQGKHYLTMDLIRGHDLETIIEQRGVIPENEVLTWGMQTCDVLDYLHGEGVIYRDMKPSNIMIEDATGQVKLVDFGIAKIFNPTLARGTQIGTPGYAPPEQYQGLATPASDIYALAATLHHLLTGRDPTEQPPFSFPPARDINPNVSRRTSDALQQALKMKPEERVPTVKEFRSLIRPLSGALPSQARVAPASGSLPPESEAAARNRTAMSPPVAGTGAPTFTLPPSPGPVSKSGGQPAPTAPPVPAVPSPAPSVRPPAPLPPVPPVTTAPAGRRTAQPAPQPQPQRRGCINRGCCSSLLLLLVLVIGGGGVGYYLFPSYWPAVQAWFEAQVAPLLQPTEPTQPALAPASQVELEVEVQVPAGADDATILSALREQYRQEISQNYPGAVISPNIPITTIGSWEQIGEENGQAIYQATMLGFVALPQGP